MWGNSDNYSSELPIKIKKIKLFFVWLIKLKIATTTKNHPGITVQLMSGVGNLPQKIN